MDWTSIWGGLTERLQSILTDVVAFAPAFIIGLAVGVLGFLAARTARQRGRALARRLDWPPQVEQLLISLAYYVLLVVSLILMLSIWGVDVIGLTAGLGIGGLVIGFAVRDLLENFIAGVLLQLQAPFKVGDYVQVAGQEGMVTDITLRATTMRTPEGVQVIIPNASVFKSTISNYSTYGFRRAEIELQIDRSFQVERAAAIFRSALEGIEGVASEPHPYLIASEVSGNRLKVRLLFWVDTRTHDIVEVRSNALRAVTRAAEENGLDVA